MRAEPASRPSNLGNYLLRVSLSTIESIIYALALQAERQEGKGPSDSIFEACMLRFRPILMTTMAALFGALPLALGTGTGSELRQPLGISIVGGPHRQSVADALYNTSPLSGV